jgi:predicted nucleotidyltransferase
MAHAGRASIRSAAGRCPGPDHRLQAPSLPASGPRAGRRRLQTPIPGLLQVRTRGAARPGFAAGSATIATSMGASASTIDVPHLCEILAAALTPVPRVAAVLLFGSVAKGLAGATSDIDLGVLLMPPPAAGERYAVLRSLLGALVGHVATERVDLVLLDDAPPALAFQALKHGRVVLCRDPVALHRFRVQTYRRHADFAPVEELFLQAARSRAHAGGRHG